MKSRHMQYWEDIYRQHTFLLMHSYSAAKAVRWNQTRRVLKFVTWFM